LSVNSQNKKVLLVLLSGVKGIWQSVSLLLSEYI